MTEGEGAPEASREDEPEPATILAQGPILVIGAFAVGGLLHLVVPLSVFPTPANIVAGAALLVIGVGIVVWGLVTLRRSDESPDHEKEPDALITEGPFAYSRNPLYLGLLVAYLGLTLLLNSLWPLGPFVVLAWYFDRMAKREEPYLDARFGEEYAEYRENVRRWL